MRFFGEKWHFGGKSNILPFCRTFSFLLVCRCVLYMHVLLDFFQLYKHSYWSQYMYTVAHRYYTVQAGSCVPQSNILWSLLIKTKSDITRIYSVLSKVYSRVPRFSRINAKWCKKCGFFHASLRYESRQDDLHEKLIDAIDNNTKSHAKK